MLNKSVVLFDLDGTLIDTKELILTSFRKGSEDVLGEALPDERVQALIGIPLIEQATILAPGHAEELIVAYRKRNKELHDQLIHYFEGTREMLDELKELGARFAVVTSKLHAPALEGLESFDLEGYFEVIIAKEDTDKHKPEPEPLLLAAERMGVAVEECVYVGDSTYDMMAARAAGMVAIAALWGMYSREELLEAGAEYEAAAPCELPGLIGNLK